MKRIKLMKRITACLLALFLAAPFTVLSGGTEASAAVDSDRTFRPEELEQMLAPIALYPDALLAQVLTAATYPLEVVEANRFVKNYPGLKDDALLAAAKDKDWQPCVKAMLGFPDLLAMMDEQLEWTRNLGDAFIVQQADCMEAVQRLRQRAYARGNLKTSAEQVIVVEPATKIIVIRPRSARIVYVPVYDPTIIYGVWWYPAYPPYYFYPRRYFGITFFPRIFVGLFWGTWDCNWHHHQVYVNINYYKTFTKTYYHSGEHERFYQAGESIQPWRYDSRHRQTSRYRTTVSVQPSAPAVQEYKPVAVKAPAKVTQQAARPAITVSTPSTKVRTNNKKAPAPVVKEPVTYRESIKSQEKAETRSSEEEETRVEASTREYKGREVKEISPGKGKAKVSVPEGIGKKVREQARSKQEDPGVKRSFSAAPKGIINAWGR
jgi:hypothetical protein